MLKVNVVSRAITPRLHLSLMASDVIAPGEPILEWTPEQITSERTWRTVQVGHGLHVKNELLDYVDHSCEPNAIVAIESRQLLALRAIAPGEPITFFYPGTEVEMAQPFRCTCGSRHCLGEIAGAFYLSADQMRAALRAGYCSSFIAAHLERLLGAPVTT